MIKNKKTELFILILVTIGGMVLRVLACFWGYPYQLHSDEFASIVYPAFDLLGRHSYEAINYNRPDHFEIKCCAVLFEAISYIVFGQGANGVFWYGYQGFFGTIARLFTTFWGTVLIPLSYMILKKIDKNAALTGAVFVAFSSIFVEHSAYSTPDIVLTFMVALMAYFSILYLEKKELRYLVLMCVVTGVGITVKYPCMFCCIYIAVLVIIESVREKKYPQIIKYGVMCASVVIATTFFLAPNLFTNFRTTIAAVSMETGGNRLGASGLGFFGNLVFYFKTIFKDMGYETVPFFLLGVFAIFKRRNKNGIYVMGLGLILWGSISALSLYWERWGIPFYICFLYASAVGVSFLLEKIGNCGEKYRLPAKIAVYAIAGIIMLNIVLSSCSYVVYKLSEDTRIAALSFCEENHITDENTFCDGWSPLAMSNASSILSRMEESGVEIDENGSYEVPDTIEYYIISSMKYAKFYSYADQCQREIAVYDGIRSQNELIYSVSANPYFGSNWAVKNIIYMVKYLAGYEEGMKSGPTIEIYRIRPAEAAVD